MSQQRIAINGFGRIGRLVFRQIYDMKGIDVVAINDLTKPDVLAHLLKYDTAQGRFDQDVVATDNSIIVNGEEIKIYSQKDPSQIPWKEHDIDVVLECTGFFADKDKASAHITAGARKVVISAPATGDLKTIVYNVNHDILDGSETVISCASCTTNCLAPMAQVLDDKYGIDMGLMVTIHGYTNDQNTQDSPHKKDMRRARAAAENIIPTSTGAAKAIGLVLPNLVGKLDGNAQRVPVVTGSLTELTCKLNKPVASEDEINAAMKSAANESFGYNEDPIVSSDIIGMTYGSLFDATLTNVIGNGNNQLVKVVSWYDNEMSYVSQLVRTLKYFAARIGD